MLYFLLGLAVGWAFAMATALFILRQVGAKATIPIGGTTDEDWPEPAEPDNPEEEDELTRYRRERERGFFA